MNKYHLATRAIHGTKLYAHKGPVSLPIYQTTNYRFETTDEAIRYAEGDDSVYVYTRYSNPTVQDVEEKLALLEGSEGAILFASGMAAISTAILGVTQTGDQIVSAPALYGGTYRFFRDELPKAGREVKYFDSSRPETIGDLISLKTKLIYFETPTNPTLSIVDIREVVSHTRKAAEKKNAQVLIMIDNTFATILNQDPISLGVDVIVESATKYLGGHSDIMGGVVFGTKQYLKKVKNAAKYYGGCADPFAAYLLYRSLKTFELRVTRQNENALAFATAIEGDGRIARVIYPGLKSHPGHDIAKKQMTGFGGMVTIEVGKGKHKAPAKAAAAVCNNLKVAVNAVSLGGTETLVSIPVYSSHVHMSDEELRNHGVAPGMIRVSIGVEGIDDIIADFQQALDHC